MNQILAHEKIYVTPELKRKKKMYKWDFCISVFLVLILFSYYIYGEYDRAKSERMSKEMLASVGNEFPVYTEQQPVEDNTTVKMEDNVLVVILDDVVEEDEMEGTATEVINIEDLIQPETTTTESIVHVAENGEEYTIVAILNISRLNINYTVLSETSEELLKISLNKFWGPDANEVGNFVVAGHNYRNKMFFGNLSEIEIGDTVELTDLTGRKLEYSVYDTYYVDPTDVSCTSQLTNGKREVTLITCSADGSERLVVKAREIE